MAKRRSGGQGSLFKRTAGGPWYSSWFDHAGERRERSTKTTDYKAAQRILARHIADAALCREGVVDARIDEYAQAERRPLVEHVREFHADLSAKGVTPKHADLVRARVEKLLDQAKAGRISDLTPSAVQAAIGAIRDAGASLQTCHHYLRAIKQFSRWLSRDGRAPSDNLAHLKGFNVATDRRHDRRAFTDDELNRLIDVAERGPMVLGISGPDRAMAYRIAVGTGFRAAELRSLAPESFDLAGDPPTVTVMAGFSKHRREDVQPIRGDLAELLRPWLAGKPAGEPVLPLPAKTSNMLRVDLAASDIVYRDDTGRVADFHALRHTYVTRLVSSGASVTAAQELARHSTPMLTIGRYAHTRLHDLTQALDNLPSVTPRKTEDADRLRATGTYNQAAKHPPLGPRNKGAKQCESVRLSARATPNVKAMAPNVTY